MTLGELKKAIKELEIDNPKLDDDTLVEIETSSTVRELWRVLYENGSLLFMDTSNKE